MAENDTIIVRADWDTDAGVWVATSDDIHGLAIEAETVESLRDKVKNAIHDLIELNGTDSPHAAVPVHLMMEQVISVPNPRH